MNQTTKKTNQDFIMSPKVDVCFAGLMENPMVRKGFCAAILRVSPETVEKTELLPTHLQRSYADDKLGILDVRVRMLDGTQINMEMQVKGYEFWDERALFYLCKMFSDQLKSGESYENLKKCIHVSILDFIRFPKDKECYHRIGFCKRKTGKLYSDKLEIQILELKKLPKEVQTGEEIVNWMRFFNGKNKEEFEQMAKKSEYLGEAYEALQKLSADDLKRLEYEAREKALKDHNSFLSSAQRIGEQRGRKIGEKRGRKIGEKLGREIGEKHGRKIGEEHGIELAKQVFQLQAQGKTEQNIASECDIPIEKVRKILA